MSIARARGAVHPEPAAPQKAPPAQHAALLLQPRPEDQLRPRGLGRIPRTPALAETLLQLGNQICPQPWVPAPIPIPRGPGNIAHKDPVSTCRSGRLAPLCPGLMPPHSPPPHPLLSSCFQRKAKGVGGVGLFPVDSGGNVPSLWTGPPVCCLVVRVNEGQIRSKK